MRIAIMSIGSRGDVQPYLALAVGFQRYGHEVIVGAPPNFADLAAKYNLAYQPLGFDSQTFLEREDVRAVIEMGNLRALLSRKVFNLLREWYDQANQAAWHMSEGADALIYKTPIYAASSIAQARQAIAIETNLFPWHPTTAFPPAYMGTNFSMGNAYNRLAWQASRFVFWQIGRYSANRFRRHTLGLPPFPRHRPTSMHRPPNVPLVFGFSPTVVPKPIDWGAGIETVGYWFLDAAHDWQPSDALRQFLASGTPPVYIGFGSMTNKNPHRNLEIALEALAKTGQRGILLGGWGGLGAEADLPDTVQHVEAVPHDWLFPRCLAVVHHGGAGTTAAGLRAGVPAIVVPHNFDQPFWGKRIHDLGVGPYPIHRRNLTADTLAHAIEQIVDNPQYKQRAQNIRQQICAEDGIQNLHDMIERMAETKSQWR